MKQPIHPFPARMAPELALENLTKLTPNCVVLDPMVGSGTVLRQATELGHCAIGFDVDPLAVLMSRVWTTPSDDALLERLGGLVLEQAAALHASELHLPWIDDDRESAEFVRYWFGRSQRADLRRLAISFQLVAARENNAAVDAGVDVLRISLSRIIVTKDRGASLARDVSHSRPHKVEASSSFSVMSAFKKSLATVRQRLRDAPPKGGATVHLGDARFMHQIEDGSVDAVLTSPPYLNAIDYLRGHRLALIWLGHPLKTLRTIRSNSVGAERSPDRGRCPAKTVQDAMGGFEELPARYGAMIERFAGDVLAIVTEISRVLSPTGRATLVVGNSCLKGVFIRNSDAVVAAADICGLRLLQKCERELPARHRYLPTPNDGALGKRMRTETILTFARAA